MREAEFTDDLEGLARQCPKCKIIAHHGVKGRKPQNIICPNCDHEFIVQKYKRGERPKAEKTESFNLSMMLKGCKTKPTRI